MSKSVGQILRSLVHYGVDVVSKANLEIRANFLLDEYRARRRAYRARAQQMGIVYDGARVEERTRARLAATGRIPTPRSVGSIHTLAFFPLIGWHPQLMRPLATLGPLSHFDDSSYGLDFKELASGNDAAVRTREQVSRIFERYAQRAAKERKIDWVFTYASAMELLPEVIDRVRTITGAPVVGMCLDDKQSWEGPPVGGCTSGQLPIAPHLDLAWTSARVACEWYMVEGGNPIFLPEGCNPDEYSPAEVQQDIDVCFVGQAYGHRQPFVSRLRSLGLRVHAAGPGWPGGALTDSDLVALFRKSKIVLGMGGIGWSKDLKNTKGRDFDAPAVGNAAYLTTYNPELADYFRIGKEIVCYSSEDECFEIAQWLLADEPRRVAIARAGRQRCLAEHTWVHRFKRILSVLGILEN